MKRLVLLLTLAVALLGASTGAQAKDKHKKHKHYSDRSSRYYDSRCDNRNSYSRSYYSRSYNDRCDDRYYRPSYSYYRPTYYAPAPVYYSNSSNRPYYRDYDNCRPVRRSSGVRLVIGF